MFIIITICSCASSDKPLIKGSTTYTKHTGESLNTELTFEQKIPIYQPSHKSYIMYIGNKIITDVDHFGKKINTNTFTSLGVDF